ncbi:hypothetical protein P7K49_015333 [Saguinus oedipus]|uniref:Uncharacterized protein n=1 Tax=Saguinus oedipus TaxID=9490 RepID=A0ABQ9VA66_SAGOE|nr:hypothetical protein P7K49_015333 [Saguinus oedipus]
MGPSLPRSKGVVTVTVGAAATSESQAWREAPRHIRSLHPLHTHISSQALQHTGRCVFIPSVPE